MEMEIQHKKLTDAKFWQYAHHVSNAHAQHKMVLEGKLAIKFWWDFLPVYGSSYSLFESNWNHDLPYLFVMQISPSIILLSVICWICMAKKSDSSWFQFDLNVVCTVTYIRKQIFFIIRLLCHLPGPFCVPHAYWKLNQNNQYFMVLADPLHKVMSKC